MNLFIMRHPQSRSHMDTPLHNRCGMCQRGYAFEYLCTFSFLHNGACHCSPASVSSWCLFILYGSFIGMLWSIGRRLLSADNHILRLNRYSYIWLISRTDRNLMMSRIWCVGTYLAPQSHHRWCGNAMTFRETMKNLSCNAFCLVS